MATMDQVIGYIDRVKPNVYTDEDKCGWIGTLDGLVAREVLEGEGPSYTFPEDMGAELLLPPPFEDLYFLYVGAMIDFHNREYDSYNNMTLMFRERYEQYKAWYIRQNPTCKARGFRNVGR